MFADPITITLGLGALLIVTGLLWPLRKATVARNDRRRRLTQSLNPVTDDDDGKIAKGRPARSFVPSALMKQATKFYAKNDPAALQVLRKKLVQAGYLSSEAVAYFFIYRFLAAGVMALAVFAIMQVVSPGSSLNQKLVMVACAGAFGYVGPSLYLDNKIKEAVGKNREGFPDFMDLMIVCADAGMSMEASIERVARELEQTRPILSMHISIVSLEIRAGRPLNETLKSLGDRLGLEEVRSFATLLQQSKELGTSLGDALKIFSDDMRNKRVMQAEEKAYALPAKMSIPVIIFMLPIVIFVAIWPVVVRYNI